MTVMEISPAIKRTIVLIQRCGAALLKERNSAVFNSEMSKSALIFQEAGG